MKRTYRFPSPSGRVTCRLRGGRRVVLPVFPAILKHLEEKDLRRFLRDPDVARKYTREALRIAAWPILREFPKPWLRTCLRDAPMRKSRRAAIRFLLA